MEINEIDSVRLDTEHCPQTFSTNSADMFEKLPARVVIVGAGDSGKTFAISKMLEGKESTNNPFYLESSKYIYYSTTNSEELENVRFYDEHPLPVMKREAKICPTLANHKVLVFDDIPDSYYNKLGEYYRFGRHSNLTVISCWHDVKTIPEVIYKQATVFIFTRGVICLNLVKVRNMLGVSQEALKNISCSSDSSKQYIVFYKNQIGSWNVINIAGIGDVGPKDPLVENFFD